MGKHNLAVNQLLERKEIFADLINGALFQGKEVLVSEKLELLSGHSGIIQEKENGKLAALERFGDIRMEADMETYSVIWSEETQNSVDYTMPVRNMLYDALEYVKQIQKIEHQHREKGEKMGQTGFLSGMKKEDRLRPVITLVLYCGECWDGSESLYEMLGIDENREEAQILKALLPDYRIHLIQPEKMENLQVFRTSLQHIFHMVKYKSDKKRMYEYMQEHREELKKMDYVEALAAFELLGESKRAEQYLLSEKEEGTVDMCKAFDGIVEDAEARGEARGEGRFAALVNAMSRDHCLHLITQAAEDVLFREQLYQQYGL